MVLSLTICLRKMSQLRWRIRSSFIILQWRLWKLKSIRSGCNKRALSTKSSYTLCHKTTSLVDKPCQLWRIFNFTPSMIRFLTKWDVRYLLMRFWLWSKSLTSRGAPLVSLHHALWTDWPLLVYHQLDTVLEMSLTRLNLINLNMWL